MHAWRIHACTRADMHAGSQRPQPCRQRPPPRHLRRFDVPLLGRTLLEHGFHAPASWRYLDTRQMASTYKQEQPGCSNFQLAVLAEHMGFTWQGSAHRAEADVHMLVHVAGGLLKHCFPEAASLGDLLHPRHEQHSGSFRQLLKPEERKKDLQEKKRSRKSSSRGSSNSAAAAGAGAAGSSKGKAGTAGAEAEEGGGGQQARGSGRATAAPSSGVQAALWQGSDASAADDGEDDIIRTTKPAAGPAQRMPSRASPPPSPSPSPGTDDEGSGADESCDEAELLEADAPEYPEEAVHKGLAVLEERALDEAEVLPAWLGGDPAAEQEAVADELQGGALPAAQAAVMAVL
jgi:hypothetical protein